MTRSVAYAKIGGTDVPDVLEPRCHTCISPLREEIEQMLLEGHGYTTVARHFPDSGLTARSIGDHVRADHIPLANFAVVARADQRAAERGELLEPAAQAAAGHLAFVKRVLGRVSERVETGEIEPTVRDGLKAAEIIERASGTSFFVSDEYDLSVQAAFSRFGEILQEELDQATSERIVARFQTDPQMAVLTTQFDAARAKA